jgi:hypothetical protein
MALKSKLAKFGFAVGMASIILSVVTWAMAQPSLSSIYRPELCFCTKSTDMRERMLLFCLLGLVLAATIILVTAPGAVTWALALIE